MLSLHRNWTNLYGGGQREARWRRAIGGAEYQIVKWLLFSVEQLSSEKGAVWCHSEVTVLVTAGDSVNYPPVISWVEVLGGHR